MTRLRLFPTLLLGLLALPASAPAQEQPKAEDAPKSEGAETKQSPVARERLEELRERLESAVRMLRSLVTPAELEQELRRRTPQFRVVKLGGPVTQPKAPVGSNSIDLSPKRSRVLGDEEKKGLASDVLMTVDGLPILEKEVKELADYFASYRKGAPEAHRQAAVEELIKIRAAEAHFAEKIQDMRNRIEAAHQMATRDGVEFGKVAREHSECPSNANGGSLGQFERNRMAPSFSHHAFDLGVGQVSEIFATPFGYHFVKVQKKLKGDTPAGDKVEAAHVLVAFTTDRNLMQKLSQRATEGACDVAVRKAEDRSLLPAKYR